MDRHFVPLLVLCLWTIALGQEDNNVVYPTPGVDQCMYTFTVPASALSAQCMTDELKNTLARVKDDYAAIKKENHDLKEQLDSIEQEYREMVNTVKLLKKETASWRAVINWPQLDEKFKPEDLSTVMKEDKEFPDCNTAMKKSNAKPGIYKIKPASAERSFFGFCDEEGWTVIYRRFDGNVTFNRNWNDFSGGFGELTGEFFVGLENLHHMTQKAGHTFHMEAMGWNGKMYTAVHEDLQVANEMENYALTVGEMTEGNYLDVFSELNGTMFTTTDRDNDEWFNNNCATYYKGGWWLKNCGFDPSRQFCEGTGCMSWGEANIKKIVMKIRYGTPPKPKGKGRKGKGKSKG